MSRVTRSRRSIELASKGLSRLSAIAGIAGCARIGSVVRAEKRRALRDRTAHLNWKNKKSENGERSGGNDWEKPSDSAGLVNPMMSPEGWKNSSPKNRGQEDREKSLNGQKKPSQKNLQKQKVSRVMVKSRNG